MKRILTKRRLAGACSVTVILAVALGAFAYWTTGGAGNASANVGTLSAPGSVSASNTYGSGTVNVSWSADHGAEWRCGDELLRRAVLGFDRERRMRTHVELAHVLDELRRHERPRRHVHLQGDGGVPLLDSQERRKQLGDGRERHDPTHRLLDQPCRHEPDERRATDPGPSPSRSPSRTSSPPASRS